MVTYVFLSVKCTKYVQTMQNQFIISLFLRRKWGEIDRFSCVRCAVPAHHFTTDLPIPTKICSSIYYNRIVDWNLYEKWPDFGTTPLWLLNCSRINLSLWITRQSSSLNTVNWRHHPSYIHPACKILAENLCLFDPLAKFKLRISGTPKNFD